MIRKTTKEILLKDLLETKQLLVEAFDDKEIPFIKGGAIDQFFIGKALEFQRNVILYDTLMKSDREENFASKYATDNIARDLADIKSKLDIQS